MARKRLNKNVVIGLTLAAFACMIVLSIVMLRQLQQRDPAYMVEMAKRQEEQEAWRTAALFYQKAWERSGDPLHLVSFGDMLLNEGEVGAARSSWEQALTSRPDLVEAHTRRVELLLELARLYGRPDTWKVLRTAADAFLESGAERTDEETACAQNAKGLALLALAIRGEDTAEAGEEALRVAIDLAPGLIDYQLDLAAHYIRQNRIEDGERVLQDLLTAHVAAGPDAVDVRLAYANYLTRQGREEESEQYFKESLTLAEGDTAALNDARLGFAEFRLQQWARARRQGSEEPEVEAWYEEAEQLLSACVDSDPDDYGAYLRLAVLYKSARRTAEVVDICEARLKRGLSRKGVEGARNRMHAYSLMIYASEACVTEAVGAQEAKDQEQKEAWLAKAERYLADARGEYSSHPRVLTQRARIKLARGLDRQALDDLRAADEVYRDYGGVNWDNRELLARLHLKLNEAGAAKDVLDEVLDEARRTRGSDVRFWALYGEVLLRNNEFDRAVAVADGILLAEPENLEASRLKARALNRLDRPRDARRMIKDPVARAIFRAREHVLEGEEEGAVAVLQEALVTAPDDPRLVGTTIRLLISLGRTAEARPVAEKALAAQPDDPKLQAFAVLVREDLSAAERDRAMLDIIEAQDDPYQRAIELIAFHVRKDAPSKALSYVNEALQHVIAKDTPAAQDATSAQHRALLQTKLSIAATLDDDASSAAARDEAAQYDVDGAGGRSILGLYHMHRKEFDRASEAFREAVDIQPTDARTWVRLGQCLQIGGRTDEAADAYGRALNVNPNEGEAHWGLALIAKVRGDVDTFERELAVCERLIPRDKRVQSELLVRRESDDPVAAIVRREQLLNEAPDDVANLKRLVVLCESGNELAKADAYYARLLDLEPDDKDVVISASRYYGRTHRPERSLEVVTRYAESRVSPDEQANGRILIASYFMGQGDPGQAESTLLAAAELAETFEVTFSLAELYLQSDRPVDALRWVSKSIEAARLAGLPRLPSALAFQIRCVLHRKVNEAERADRLVEALLSSFPDYAPALILQSEVYDRMGRMKQAVAVLTEYLSRRPNDAEALYRRALHYRAAGRLPAAIGDLEAIKQHRSLALDLRPRLLLAELHRQAGRVELWVRELESLVEDAPDAAHAIEELAKAYIHQQRFTDAERLVTAQINRGGEAPDSRWFFLHGQISLALGEIERAIADSHRGAEVGNWEPGVVARVLDLYIRLGKFAEGIRYYETHESAAESAPTPIARYARLHALAGRFSDAVVQFQKAMEKAGTVSPEAVAAVSVELRASFPTRERASNAISLFRDSATGAAATKRANNRILVHLYRIAGRFEEAASLLDGLIEESTGPRERGYLLQELGDVYQLSEKPEQARQAYEKSLEDVPDNWATLNNLAYLLSDQLGEYELARRHAERAVVIVDSPDTLDTLGWIYVGLGEYQLAIAELSRAIGLDPKAALTFYHLGEAYRRSEAFGDAMNILASGRELAQAAANHDLVARFDEAIERVGRSDTAP